HPQHGSAITRLLSRLYSLLRLPQAGRIRSDANDKVPLLMTMTSRTRGLDEQSKICRWEMDQPNGKAGPTSSLIRLICATIKDVFPIPGFYSCSGPACRRHSVQGFQDAILEFSIVYEIVQC